MPVSYSAGKKSLIRQTYKKVTYVRAYGDKMCGSLQCVQPQPAVR